MGAGGVGRGGEGGGGGGGRRGIYMLGGVEFTVCVRSAHHDGLDQIGPVDVALRPDQLRRHRFSGVEVWLGEL